jgi:hypothetical protein
MKTRVELIGKERAEYYLSLNRKNRPIKINRVQQYINEINNGSWKENTGESIKISNKGFLIDGQHRLTAISKTDKFINFLVVYDLEESIFDVLDSGRVRGATDVFALEGVKNYVGTSSIIRSYLSFKNGSYYDSTATANIKFTNASLLTEYKKNPLFYDNITLISKRYRESFNSVLEVKTIGALFILFGESSEQLRDIFFDEFLGSLNSNNKSILMLKNVLIKDKVSNKKLTPKVKIAYIIKTWNAYVLQKDIKCLKFDDKKDSFPVII